jgi:hypothetical protein
VNKLSAADLSTMVNQVGFEMSWGLLVPSNSGHRDISAEAVSLGRSFARKLGRVASETREDPLDGGNTNLSQVSFEFGRKGEFGVLG